MRRYQKELPSLAIPLKKSFPKNDENIFRSQMPYNQFSDLGQSVLISQIFMNRGFFSRITHDIRTALREGARRAYYRRAYRSIPPSTSCLHRPRRYRFDQNSMAWRVCRSLSIPCCFRFGSSILLKRTCRGVIACRTFSRSGSLQYSRLWAWVSRSTARSVASHTSTKS